MQRKKILEFASWLERQRNAFFDMTIPCHCISGWALRWLYPEGIPDGHFPSKFTLVCMFGIGEDAAMALYVCDSKKDWDKVTRMDAVRALRNVAHRRKQIWEC